MEVKEIGGKDFAGHLYFVLQFFLTYIEFSPKRLCYGADSPRH